MPKQADELLYPLPGLRVMNLKLKRLLKKRWNFLYRYLQYREHPFIWRGTAKNLFFFNTYFQMMQMQALITQEGLKDNYGIMLVPVTSKELHLWMLEKIDRSLFKHISILYLPSQANSFFLGRLWLSYLGYKKVISKIAPQRVFTFNYEGHHALALQIAKQSGCELGLIEEGGSTYKLYPDGENFSPITSFPTRYSRFCRLFFKYLPLFKNYQAVLEGWKGFECVYLAFPGYVHKFLGAQKSVRFNMFTSPFWSDPVAQKVVQDYDIGGEDYVFIDGRTPLDGDIYVKSLCKILDDLSAEIPGRIFVKPHPAAHKVSLKIIEKLQRSLAGSKVVFWGGADCLIESIIMEGKVKGVFCFSSSSLLYLPEVCPNTVLYSVTPWFIRESMHNGMSSQSDLEALDFLRDQLQFYKQFSRVTELASVQDFILSNVA